MKKKLSLFLAIIMLFISLVSLLSLVKNFDYYVAYADDDDTPFIDYEDVYIPSGYSYYGAWRWAVNNKYYIGYFTSSPYVNGTEMMYSYADGGNSENIKTCLNYKLYGGNCLYYKFDSYEDMVLGLSSADTCSRLSVSSNSSTGYMRLTAYPDVYFSNFSISSGDCIFNQNPYSAKLIDTYLGRNNNNSGYWIGAVVGSHNVSGFSEWFLKENKVNDLVNVGFSISTDKVYDVINWWDKYGGSAYSIGIGLPALVSITAINNLSISLVERVVYTLDSLYLQYQVYCDTQDLALIDPNKNTAHMPHHRLPVDDDDDDYTLTTDSEDDDTIILILRDILRTIIYLPTDISVNFNYLRTYFDAILIDFNYLFDFVTNLPVNIANEIKLIFNGFGFADIDFKISDLLGDIKLSIENTVESSKENLEELFIPTSEPFTELKEEIYLKLPVLNQLSRLPNFDGYLEDNENNTPETVSLSAVDSVSSSGSNSLSMFNVSFYDSSVYNGISFDIVDFTKWQKAIDAFKGICSVVIIFHFVHWLIAFIPKLLSGYNSSN